MVIRQQGKEGGGGRLRENLQNLIWELLHGAMIRKKGEILTFLPTVLSTIKVYCLEQIGQINTKQMFTKCLKNNDKQLLANNPSLYMIV